MRSWIFLLVCLAPGGGCDNDVAGTDPVDAAASLDTTPSPDLTGAPDDLSPLLESLRRHGGLPALGAAVFRGPALVAIGVTGVRQVDDPTLATVDDSWHLGSDTKAMTATLIGLHVDRGEIHFEDTLATLFAGEK